MGKRGLARDRMTDAAARSFRKIARTARNLMGITNQDIADCIPGWSLQKVVHTLASGRPLRRANLEKLLQGLRDARPARLRRDQGISQAIDALIAPIEQPSLVPPALIPLWAVPAVAAYLVQKLSRPGTRRKELTSALERTLKSVAEEMANQAYQLNRGRRWIDDQSAAALLRRFGFKVRTVPDLIYEKRS